MRQYKYQELNGKKLIVTDDAGLPLVVNDDGNEVPLDGIHLLDKIPVLQAEAKKHREAKEAAETALKSYEGLDPEKAREAVRKISDIDLTKLIDKGKVEEVRAEVKASYEAKLKEVMTEIERIRTESETAIRTKDGNIKRLLVSGAFSRSAYLKKTTFPTPGSAEAFFQNNFHIAEDNGQPRILAKHDNGTEILSRTRLSEPADFEEALQILVESHPDRDVLLRATGKQMNQQGGGTYTKQSELEALSKMTPDQLLQHAFK